MRFNVRSPILLVVLCFATTACSPTSSAQNSKVTKMPQSIGVATIAEDGTIRLQLRAESPNGAIGDGLLFYRPGDSMYSEVMRHIGSIRLGEEKPVPPWPSPTN